MKDEVLKEAQALLDSCGGNLCGAETRAYVVRTRAMRSGDRRTMQLAHGVWNMLFNAMHRLKFK